MKTAVSQANIRPNHSDVIVARKLELDLDRPVPRHWCNDSAFMTHMLNIYTLLVPDNENYYIRQLRSCSDDISDPALAASLHVFCRQEAQHGIGHKAYWHKLDELGLKHRAFVSAIGWFNYRFLEPILPRAMHLAIIACIEHVNAYLGSFYLKRDLLEKSDPTMKLLFYWHFAEEIEHKSVAFDVYQHLYGSYLLRLLAATLIFPMFYTVNTVGTFYLVWQDGEFLRKSTWVDFYCFLFKQGALRQAFRKITDFLNPRFHPANTNETALVRDFFADAMTRQHIRDYPAA